MYLPEESVADVESEGRAGKKDTPPKNGRSSGAGAIAKG